MSDAITLITPTGERPEAFSLCEKLISRQLTENTEWIVIDDGKEPTKVNFGQTYIRGPKTWQLGINTQRYNLDTAIPHIKGDYIFIIEDDDYYGPTYIKEMLTQLKLVEAVGLSNAHYYHIGVPGYLTLKNYEHSALSQTAFRKSQLKQFELAIHSGEYYFDIAFWKMLRKGEVPFSLLANTKLSVGMKGLPGRAGLGAGHSKLKGYLHDSGHGIIKDWLGSDAELYYPFLRGKKPIAVAPLR